MITIENFLSQESCERIKKEIKKYSFEDGLKTAGGMASNVKNNLQLDPKRSKSIADDIKNLILSDPRLRDTVFPKDIGRIFINRYDEGMEYGIHSDASYMNGLRTDISFTIFLEDPTSYDGGELIMHYPHGTMGVKPQRGSIVLYSTGVMHRVEKVTRGSRLACVGWIRSHIQDEAKREIIRELKHVHSHYYQCQGHDFAADLFLKNIQNLERLWGD